VFPIFCHCYLSASTSTACCKLVFGPSTIEWKSIILTFKTFRIVASKINYKKLRACFLSVITSYPTFWAKSSHRPIVLLESGFFFRDYRYLCHQVPDRLTAFLNFWFQIVIMVELLVQKISKLKFSFLQKLWPKKCKIFAHFLVK
jgi:hypothetical protein